jgi:hypothetical protein
MNGLSKQQMAMLLWCATFVESGTNRSWRRDICVRPRWNTALATCHTLHEAVCVPCLLMPQVTIHLVRLIDTYQVGYVRLSRSWGHVIPI